MEVLPRMLKGQLAVFSRGWFVLHAVRRHESGLFLSRSLRPLCYRPLGSKGGSADARSCESGRCCGMTLFTEKVVWGASNDVIEELKSLLGE